MSNKRKKNFLLRVKAVVELYNEHKKEGVSAVWVHKAIIYPRFYISRSTLYEYLSINYKKQLKEIDDEIKQRWNIAHNWTH